MNSRGKNILRTVFLAAACAFLLYGLTRGEMAVVYGKAVNICLECIGIG